MISTEIKELQNDTVKELINTLSKKDEVVFKAPTGSGKTYMMGDFMNKILDSSYNESFLYKMYPDASNSDIVFLVSSLSKSGLAEQNYDNFKKNSEDGTFKNIKPYLITSNGTSESGVVIYNTCNVYVLGRDLYHKNTKLMAGPMEKLLTNFKSNGKILILIKDECHIKTNNLDELINKGYFSKVINFSATPKLKKTEKPDVVLGESDAIACNLIKRVEYQSEDDELWVALDKLKSLKKVYEEVELGCKPCLIIQISNKDKADDEMNNIKKILNQTEYQDLQWMLITGKEKENETNTILSKLPVSEWKKDAKKNTSTIDVIIFKMIITEGWNIPRACLLYQIRDSQSETLDEQVIGRVRRNPVLKDFDKVPDKYKKEIMTAYVWGVSEENDESCVIVKPINNKIQEDFKINITRIKRPNEIPTFDVQDIIEKSAIDNDTSIFELNKKLNNLPEELKQIVRKEILNTKSWYDVCTHLSSIKTAGKKISEDYEHNLEIATDEDGQPIIVTVPNITYYIESNYICRVSNWLWQKVNSKDKSYSFDSEAEKKWCEYLIDNFCDGTMIKHIQSGSKYINMFGKNYLPNSEIKFEYYHNGIHSSYPDFILKDKQNNIHFFETKSLNKSASINMDDDEYKNKIEDLKNGYEAASKLLCYYFHIPIMQGDEWRIWTAHNGNKIEYTSDEFIDAMERLINNIEYETV